MIRLHLTSKHDLNMWLMRLDETPEAHWAVVRLGARAGFHLLLFDPRAASDLIAAIDAQVARDAADDADALRAALLDAPTAMPTSDGP